jgi:hypothetical protein
MKRLLFGLWAILASTSASAITVYNCDVTAHLKKEWSFLDDGRSAWTKTILLSPSFTTEVDFQVGLRNTILDLSTDSRGTLKGTVNGQEGFILEGTVKRGRFESAVHKGTIVCGEGYEQPVVFQFHPWKQFFTLDRSVNQKQILTQVALDGLKNYCYLGVAAEAERQIMEVQYSPQVISQLRKSGSLEGEYLEFSWWQYEETAGHGNNVDDWVTDKMGWVKHTAKLMACDWTYHRWNTEDDHP